MNSTVVKVMLLKCGRIFIESNKLLFLQGFAIGNGLTDPEIQYKAYADYALEMGLIGGDDYNRVTKLYPACDMSIKLCGITLSTPF